MRSQFVCAALFFFCGFSAWLPNALATPDPDIPLPISKSDALMLHIPTDIENGARIFAGCVGCHDSGPSALNRVGPILNDIIGRKAGSIEGYDYSKALVRAGKNGLVWTPYKLDAFLMSPNDFLGGNKMPFVGLKDERERRDLIGYLKTLK